MNIKDNSSQTNQQLDENILNYIKRELKRGIPSASIRDTLLRVGHHPLKVDSHLRYFEAKNRKKPWLLAYLLVLFAVLLAISCILNIVLYKKITLVQRYNDLVYESKDLCTKGEYDKAYKKLEKAVELDDKRAFAYAIYGHCYLLQNKNADAVGALTEALKRGSADIYFYRLGVAYCSLNSFNLGIANLRRSIELNPANPDFNKALGDCYSKSGNKNESDKYHMK